VSIHAFFVSDQVLNVFRYISALTIGMSYLLGGLIPLLPYFFIDHATTALLYSSVVTATILLIFGVVKARVSGAAQTTGGYIWSAATTMLVGGAAAGVAYGVVAALEGAGN
jgi:VIT1/CCC1 family predicted Fe2+/Mn2+ transporter